MKLVNKDSFSKFGQISRKLRIWSHLPKKFLMENFILCRVNLVPRKISILEEPPSFFAKVVNSF